MSDNKIGGRKKIGEIIIEMGFLTAEQIENALVNAKKAGQKLGQYLLQQKMLNDVQFTKALACHYNLEYKDLTNISPEPAVLAQIPHAIATKHLILPFALKDGIIQLAIHDAASILNLGEARKTMKYDYAVFLSSQTQITNAIHKFYSQQPQPQKKMDLTIDIFGQKRIRADGVLSIATSPAKAEPKVVPKVAIKENDNDNESITIIINRIIERAIVHHASDIHIEPDDNKLRVRERLDGILHEREVFPLAFHALIISRIKVMGNLDIAEKRISQDGRFNYNLNGVSVDFRLSTLPTVKGEKIVLRLLDQSNLKVNLYELGMNEQMLLDIKGMLMQPHGIVLVTGPTGSGKTTTVYSMINCINDIEKNIITVEDPVEYRFKIINQVQVNNKAGLTFPVALRTILRQDPDVIMIGEIRDRETAEIAIRAALTGHLVISTLHTNDSLKAIDRLIDIGIEPYLIVSSLLGIVAQRLIRKLCPHCKVEEDREEKLALLAHIMGNISTIKKIYKAVGCDQCHQTGHAGRVALYEILSPNIHLGRAIKDRANLDTLYKIAKESGFKSIRENAIFRLLQGETSVEEVVSAVGSHQDYEEMPIAKSETPALVDSGDGNLSEAA